MLIGSLIKTTASCSNIEPTYGLVGRNETRGAVGIRYLLIIRRGGSLLGAEARHVRAKSFIT